MFDSSYSEININKPICSHEIGSQLLGCDTEASDKDYFYLYSSNIVCQKLHPRINEYIVDKFTKNLVTGYKSDFKGDSETDHLMTLASHIIFGIYNIGNLREREGKKDELRDYIPSFRSKLSSQYEVDNMTQLRFLLWHFWAIKADLITVHDQKLYSTFIQVLNAPIWVYFIDYAKNMIYHSLASLPDKENNWSQGFDGSSKQEEMKNNWMNLNITYPTVKECGYDPRESYYTFIAVEKLRCLLEKRIPSLTSEEKQYLIALKEGTLSFEDYVDLKNKKWRRLRKTHELAPRENLFWGIDKLDHSKFKCISNLNDALNILEPIIYK